jgi:DNA processing protein
VATRCIEPGAPDYPARIERLARAAPWCRGTAPRLFVRGTLPTGPAVAIVGSRKVEPAVALYAYSLARRFGQGGFTVASGGARGVDRAAHDGAMSVDATTVLFAPGGLDVPYPAEHADLYDRVLARGGALLSLRPDGKPPQHGYFFLQRNWLMMASCEAAIVVHAGARSGSLAAASAAEALGVPVYFVPVSPWSDHGHGTLRALQDGATPLWHLDGAPALLRRQVVEAAPPTTDAPDAAVAVHRLLGLEPLHIDRIARRAGITLADAEEALFTLLCEGYAVEGPPGHYARVPGSRL